MTEEGTEMPEDSSQQVREQLVQLLIDKIASDTYPSTTMMDMVEELLEPHMVEAYARTLMEKVARDTYPSVSLLARVRNLS
jgi:hypothetical protein